ncbi:uncharacterized protein DFL_005766 [Arthrobotrys flagrans]|uniref:PIN domain-containing protein n=1 Tax=Arthrobotrys flagrans TaxID=97331 RepID=A0A436ZYT5_ARTFL|nr:hypothetical protein DFL_005766 [Arthrobotrys flagrans]
MYAAKRIFGALLRPRIFSRIFQSKAPVESKASVEMVGHTGKAVSKAEFDAGNLGRVLLDTNMLSRIFDKGQTNKWLLDVVEKSTPAISSYSLLEYMSSRKVQQKVSFQEVLEYLKSQGIDVLDGPLSDEDSSSLALRVLEKTYQSIFNQPSASKPSASEPSASEPSASEPSATKPSSSKPSSSEPSSSEPSTSEPSSSKPSATKPSVRKRLTRKRSTGKRPSSEPSTSETSTSESPASEPSASEPSSSKPSATKPSTTKLSARKPSTTKPSARKPSTTKRSTGKRSTGKAAGHQKWKDVLKARIDLALACEGHAKNYSFLTADKKFYDCFKDSLEKEGVTVYCVKKM